MHALSRAIMGEKVKGWPFVDIEFHHKLEW